MFDEDLTEIEAEFFAEGRALEHDDSFADLDVGFERPSFWRRLFSRSDAE